MEVHHAFTNSSKQVGSHSSTHEGINLKSFQKKAILIIIKAETYNQYKESQHIMTDTTTNKEKAILISSSKSKIWNAFGFFGPKATEINEKIKFSEKYDVERPINSQKDDSALSPLEKHGDDHLKMKSGVFNIGWMNNSIREFGGKVQFMSTYNITNYKGFQDLLPLIKIAKS